MRANPRHSFPREVLRPTPEAQSLHEEVDRIFRSIAM